MKRFLRIALIYAICGMAAGVFFREYTKFSGFTGSTTLSVVHTHLLMLGMFGFLLFGLLNEHAHFTGSKYYRPFMVCYNIGLSLAAAMMLVRGIWQVEALPDTAAISGIAGVGHILLSVGILLLFAALFESFRQSGSARASRERV